MLLIILMMVVNDGLIFILMLMFDGDNDDGDGDGDGDDDSVVAYSNCGSSFNIFIIITASYLPYNTTIIHIYIYLQWLHPSCGGGTIHFYSRSTCNDAILVLGLP